MSGGLTVEIDPDLEDLIPVFMSRRRYDLVLLHRHLEIGDFEAIRALGHTLKGTAAGYGFEILSQIGARIEDAANRGDPTGVTKCADEMKTHLDTVRLVHR